MATNRLFYLGQGLEVPLKVSQYGRLALATDFKLIQQSIYSILGTPIGSRFFLRDYGSNLHSLLFEPNDEILKALLDEFIGDALETWEPRIKITDIQYTFQDEGAVYCQLKARILANNQIQQFEYVFDRNLNQ